MKIQICLLAITGFIMGSCSGNKKSGTDTIQKPSAYAEASIVSVDTTVTQVGYQEEYIEEVEEMLDIPPRPVATKAFTAEETQQFLHKYNLSSVWMSTRHTEETAANVYNGFYGTDRYRIEMYIASVTKDTLQEHVYLIEGKSRFKGNIIPFKGKIMIDSLYNIDEADIDAATIDNVGFKEVYTAKGSFQLEEASTYKGSGVFAGQVSVDLGIRKGQDIYKDNEVDTWSILYKAIDEESGVQFTGDSRGAGFLLDGNWTSYTNGVSKPVLVVQNIYMISNDILENFMIGERDVVINPKYRNLGWDNFWENEEWWNEAKPIL